MRKKLKDKKDYPFRASLTKTARCGMCRNLNRTLIGYECSQDLKVKYPTLNHEHHCKFYEFKKVTREKITRGKIKIPIAGIINQFKECKSCAYNFKRICDGVWIYPFERNPICEFYRNKNLICKHARPYLQYLNHSRNNYCSLHPVHRDRDMNRGWKWSCPSAHREYAKSYSCYQPIKESLFESQDCKINLNSVIGLAVSLIIMRELLPIALTAIRPSNWFVRLYYRIKYFFKKWIFQILFWSILGSEILLMLLLIGGLIT